MESQVPDKRMIPALSYHFLTPLYDPLLGLMGFESHHRLIVNLLRLRPGEHLLDVGCGTGFLLIYAKREHPNVSVTGIDLDLRMLKRAQSKLKKENVEVSIKQSSASQLSFPDGSFDVVVSTLVFHHLPIETKRATLREIERVLKPDGRFLLVDFGTGRVARFLYGFTRLFNVPEATTLKDNVDGNLPAMLEAAGFTYKIVAQPHWGIEHLLATKRDKKA